MKQIQLTYLLAMSIHFILVSCGTDSQNSSDSVAPNKQNLRDINISGTELINKLKDIRSAFNINNIVEERYGTILLYLNLGNSEESIKSTLNDYIKEYEELKKTHFYDKKLNTYVDKFLALTIQHYKIAQSKGFHSSEFEKNFENYEKENKEYFDYLYSAYSQNQFISITEGDMLDLCNKNKRIKSPQYETYKNLKTTNLKAALKLLHKIAEQTTDFEEYSIYRIELADQYVEHKFDLEDDAVDKAIGIYKSLLDQKKYSIYLFEAWEKWRSVTQFEYYGSSNFSEIPNAIYDKARNEAVSTILAHINKHSNDEMAIYEFLCFVTHGIISRFGDNPYGNQNVPEYYKLYKGSD